MIAYLTLLRILRGCSPCDLLNDSTMSDACDQVPLDESHAEACWLHVETLRHPCRYHHLYTPCPINGPHSQEIESHDWFYSNYGSLFVLRHEMWPGMHVLPVSDRRIGAKAYRKMEG
jgi:hypothetical protein